MYSFTIVFCLFQTLHMNGISRHVSFLAMAGLSLTTLISTFVIYSSKIESDTEDIKESNLKPKAIIDNKKEIHDDLIILNNEPNRSSNDMETIKVDNMTELINDMKQKSVEKNDIIESESVKTKLKSLKEKLFSMLYVTFVAWHILTYLRFSYFFGTINNTIEKLTNGDKVSG